MPVYFFFQVELASMVDPRLAVDLFDRRPVFGLSDNERFLSVRELDAFLDFGSPS